MVWDKLFEEEDVPKVQPHNAATGKHPKQCAVPPSNAKPNAKEEAVFPNIEKAKYIWSLGARVSDDFITRLQNSLGSMNFLPGVNDARAIIYDLLHENMPEFGEVDLNKIKWLC